MAAAQVLYERMPGRDGARGREAFESSRIGRSRVLSLPWSASIALFGYRSVTCRAAASSSSTAVDRCPVGGDLDRGETEPQRAGKETSL